MLNLLGCRHLHDFYSLTQRDKEIKAAVSRTQKLQELLDRYGTMCQRHRNQYVFGNEWSSNQLHGADEMQPGKTDITNSVLLGSKECVICESERLHHIEIRFLHAVAENEKLRRCTGLGPSDTSIVKVSDLSGASEADIPVATSVIISLEERLVALESEVTAKTIKIDDLTEAIEDLKRTIEQREETVLQLERNIEDMVEDTYKLNDVLKEERNRLTNSSAELGRANAAIQSLQAELQQTKDDAEKIASDYLHIRKEAKAQRKELKNQLQTAEQRCAAFEETEKNLRQEIKALQETLEAERTGVMEFKETLKQHLDEKQQSVS
jgi:DNA repair exonuclease SbcCD ATPase subunit